MITTIQRKRTTLTYRIFSAFLTLAFVTSSIIPPQRSYAQVLPVIPPGVLNLPSPGTMVPLSPAFNPPIIKGITIHPENPLLFDFIVHPGDDNLKDQDLEDESTKLIKYFMAALTVPEDQMWVNLSPYEKDRIVPNSLGQTEMGRDLLAQDYLLKQLTASLMYPEDELGSEFWDRVYKKTYEQYGTTEIPLNTFNKIWIMPETASIYENGRSVFVVDSHLKVMLEEDYLALEINKNRDSHGIGNNTITPIETGIESEIIREILIPEIEKEVNTGKTFANLRQIYNSVILATWYKQNLKESLLGQVYVDQNKTKGIDIEDKQINAKIYNQYLEAFKVGVYDYIKEDYDPRTNEIIPRKYFSGGVAISSPILEVDVNPGIFLKRKQHNVRVKLTPIGDMPMGVSGEVASSPVGGMATKKTKKDQLVDKLIQEAKDLFDKRRFLNAAEILKQVPSSAKNNKKLKKLKDYVKLEVNQAVHELRSPTSHLAGAWGWLEHILTHESVKGLTKLKQAEERLKKLEELGRKALTFINDIQDIAYDERATLIEKFEKINEKIYELSVLIEPIQSLANSLSEVVERVDVKIGLAEYSSEEEVSVSIEEANRLELLVNKWLIPIDGIKKESVPIRNVIAEVIAAAKVAYKEADIQIQDSPLSSKIMAHGVAIDLKQVFVNLLNNSLEAKADAKIDIEIRREGKKIVVIHSDNGPGIAPDFLPHIFKPFKTTKGDAGGTGLGLAIVEKLIKDHNGKIKVESELGQGTTFTVSLPAALASSPIGANEKFIDEVLRLKKENMETGETRTSKFDFTSDSKGVRIFKFSEVAPEESITLARIFDIGIESHRKSRVITFDGFGMLIIDTSEHPGTLLVSTDYAACCGMAVKLKEKGKNSIHLGLVHNLVDGKKGLYENMKEVHKFVEQEFDVLQYITSYENEVYSLDRGKRTTELYERDIVESFKQEFPDDDIVFQFETRSGDGTSHFVVTIDDVVVMTMDDFDEIPGEDLTKRIITYNWKSDENAISSPVADSAKATAYKLGIGEEITITLKSPDKSKSVEFTIKKNVHNHLHFSVPNEESKHIIGNISTNIYGHKQFPIYLEIANTNEGFTILDLHKVLNEKNDVENPANKDAIKRRIKEFINKYPKVVMHGETRLESRLYLFHVLYNPINGNILNIDEGSWGMKRHNQVEVVVKDGKLEATEFNQDFIHEGLLSAISEISVSSPVQSKQPGGIDLNPQAIEKGEQRIEADKIASSPVEENAVKFGQAAENVDDLKDRLKNVIQFKRVKGLNALTDNALTDAYIDIKPGEEEHFSRNMASYLAWESLHGTSEQVRTQAHQLLFAAAHDLGYRNDVEVESGVHLAHQMLKKHRTTLSKNEMIEVEDHLNDEVRIILKEVNNAFEKPKNYKEEFPDLPRSKLKDLILLASTYRNQSIDHFRESKDFPMISKMPFIIKEMADPDPLKWRKENINAKSELYTPLVVSIAFLMESLLDLHKQATDKRSNLKIVKKKFKEIDHILMKMQRLGVPLSYVFPKAEHLAVFVMLPYYGKEYDKSKKETVKDLLIERAEALAYYTDEGAALLLGENGFHLRTFGRNSLFSTEADFYEQPILLKVVLPKLRALIDKKDKKAKEYAHATIGGLVFIFGGLLSDDNVYKRRVIGFLEYASQKVRDPKAVLRDVFKGDFNISLDSLNLTSSHKLITSDEIITMMLDPRKISSWERITGSKNGLRYLQKYTPYPSWSRHESRQDFEHDRLIIKHNLNTLKKFALGSHIPVSLRSKADKASSPVEAIELTPIGDMPMGVSGEVASSPVDNEQSEKQRGLFVRSALTDENISVFQKEISNLDWAKANKIDWVELVREAVGQNEAPATTKQKIYFANQVLVRAKILLLLKKLALGENIQNKEFVKNFRDLHATLLVGVGNSFYYSFDRGDDPGKAKKAAKRSAGVFIDEKYGANVAKMIRDTLKGYFNKEIQAQSVEEKIVYIADFYENMIKAQNVFPYGNNSYLMQWINTLLRLTKFDGEGLNGVSHGYIDEFVRDESAWGRIDATAHMYDYILMANPRLKNAVNVNRFASSPSGPKIASSPVRVVDDDQMWNDNREKAQHHYGDLLSEIKGRFSELKQAQVGGRYYYDLLGWLVDQFEEIAYFATILEIDDLKQIEILKNLAIVYFKDTLDMLEAEVEMISLTSDTESVLNNVENMVNIERIDALIDTLSSQELLSNLNITELMNALNRSHDNYQLTKKILDVYAQLYNAKLMERITNMQKRLSEIRSVLREKRPKHKELKRKLKKIGDQFYAKQEKNPNIVFPERLEKLEDDLYFPDSPYSIKTMEKLEERRKRLFEEIKSDKIWNALGKEYFSSKDDTAIEEDGGPTSSPIEALAGEDVDGIGFSPDYWDIQAQKGETPILISLDKVFNMSDMAVGSSPISKVKKGLLIGTLAAFPFLFWNQAQAQVSVSEDSVLKAETFKQENFKDVDTGFFTFIIDSLGYKTIIAQDSMDVDSVKWDWRKLLLRNGFSRADTTIKEFYGWDKDFYLKIEKNMKSMFHMCIFIWYTWKGLFRLQ